jgi:spheroidene monooxygenase
MNDNQCTSISFFRFEGVFNKTWGFSQLLNSKFILRQNKNIDFFKPLGTGSGLGYRAWPKFSVIGLMIVWKNREEAFNFTESSYFRSLQSKSKEQYTIFMDPVSSRGTWSGFNQWGFAEPNQFSKVICALTRATIKPKFLFDFWRMVPNISKKQYKFPGLIFSQGIGEIPFLEQATFTIWENKKSMEDFALRTFHGKAVEKVRSVNGFKEQMFTRFQPVAAFGTWEGKNILENYAISSFTSEKVIAPAFT